MSEAHRETLEDVALELVREPGMSYRVAAMKGNAFALTLNVHGRNYSVEIPTNDLEARGAEFKALARHKWRALLGAATGETRLVN
jgi:hypothetical protein